MPCQLYRTGDGWIYVMCNKPKFWTALCHAIGRADLASDPDYASFGDRLARREELTTILDAAFSISTPAEWLERLKGQVPVALVRTPREALLDPEARKKGRVETCCLAE